MGSELLSTLMHPADLARFDEHLARLDSAQDDDVLEFEYRMRHKDGSWRFRSRDAVFDRSSAGRPTSIVGVATEITERKNHEQRCGGTRTATGSSPTPRRQSGSPTPAAKCSRRGLAGDVHRRRRPG